MSEWVIKFNDLSWTAGSEVHVVHISRVIIAVTSGPIAMKQHDCSGLQMCWCQIDAKLCAGIPPVLSGFPSQRASYVKNVSMSSRYEQNIEKRPRMAEWVGQRQLNTDGLMQDCSISSALAIEILQSCTKPPIHTPGIAIIGYIRCFLSPQTEFTTRTTHTHRQYPADNPLTSYVDSSSSQPYVTHLIININVVLAYSSPPNGVYKWRCECL